MGTFTSAIEPRNPTLDNRKHIRVQGVDRPNTLDLVFTDVPDIVDVKVKLPIGGSDHHTLSVSLTLRQSAAATEFRKEIYLKNRVNWDYVHSDVESLPWRTIIHCEDPINSLNTNMLSIIKRRVPVRTLTLKSSDKPWFDGKCKGAHSEKQAAFHTGSRNRSRENWLRFVTKRSTAERIYSNAETMYNDRLRDNLENAQQPHKWWSSLKTSVFGSSSLIPALLSSDGALVANSKDKAELLLSHFEAKQSRNIVNTPLTCHPEPSFTKFAFRSKEVRSLLNDLDEYGGTDPVGMFPLFLKKIADILAPKLSVIFRSLIRQGSFPKCWRTANIVPIPKGAVSPQASNYRPISLTPLLSKVYEKLLSSRLGSYFEKNNIYPTNQFAYRKNLGTCDALLSISHKLQMALDSGSEARAVQIDFSAAFDRVNHIALLHKLKSVGVGGSVLSIATEFLRSRVQRVCVDGCYSNFSNVISGVPQGSVLGPLLFILYTADLYNIVKNDLFGYADDKTLLSVIPSPADRQTVAVSLNRDLELINEWCEVWDMGINCTKTQSITFSRSRTKMPLHPPLSISGAALDESSSLKNTSAPYPQVQRKSWEFCGEQTKSSEAPR
ncbi:hypothetical protein SNEBB_010891 [Seison nebaliae]|nr:hypothetical protein SNEBB_010891 [Seison nebaliae]